MLTPTINKQKKVCQTEGRNLYAHRLSYMHLALLILTGLVIVASYLAGYFGGREYLEFPPALAFPMLITWILFMINFFGTLRFRLSEWKIYHWMWSTGVLFFFITFGEAYLWTFDFFNRNQIRDVTVQWKAMGSMVGSWNMLIYGTAFYIMEKISGNEKVTISLILFWFSLIGSGLVKAVGEASGLEFRLIMTKAMPIFTMFSVAGLGILAGLVIISLPAISLLGSKAIINAKLLLKRMIT